MRVPFRLFAAFFVLGLSAAAAQTTRPATQPTAQLTVVTDRPQAIYSVGEQAHFVITLKDNPSPPPDAEVTYILDKDGVPPVTDGKAKLQKGHATVEGTLNEPGFLRCRITYTPVAGQPPITAMASAAFDPLKIAPSLPVPEDFDAFWANEKARLATIPMTPTLTPVPSHVNGVESFDVQIPCVPPKPVSGYFSRPIGAAPKSLPAILQVHAAGVNSSVLGVTANWAKHLNVLAMDINAHGIPNGQPESFYKKLSLGELYGYPYFGEGNRDTCYFLAMFLRMQRAIDFLTSQPEWDGKILIVCGSSQGGGQAVVAAALDHRVTLITAAVPALCDHTGMLVGRIAGWPKLIPKKDPTQQEIQSARYFDCMNFATRAKAEAVFCVGFIDGTAPPTSIYAMYNNYAGKKQIINGPLEGHANWKDYIDAADAAITRQLQNRQKQMSLDLGDNVSLKLVEIPAGSFLMGSPESEPGRKKDETQHDVTLTKPFFIGAYPVTVDQYAQFVKETGYKTDAEQEGFSYGHDIKDGKIQYHHEDFAVKGCDWKNPSIDQKGNYPVVQMSWNDSKAFCDWLAKKTAKNATLPTEAQFEYASRAGTTTAYPWGDNPDDGQGWANVGDQTYKNSFDNAPATIVYFTWNDGYAFTSPVGIYKPNAFGLYDTTGNVWEWCADWYAPFTKDPATDPAGPPTGKSKVAHGGSYFDPPKMCRFAARGKDGPKARGTMGGFRVALSP